MGPENYILKTVEQKDVTVQLNLNFLMKYLYRQERLKLEEDIRMSRTNQQQQLQQQQLDEDIRMARINQQTTVHQQHQEQHLHYQHQEQQLHQVKNSVQPFVLPLPWVF